MTPKAASLLVAINYRYFFGSATIKLRNLEKMGKSPKPGAPVRGSESGRPIMAALDLLGRRWTLRILWELREGPLSFRTIQARCDKMSPSVLNRRLAELREAGVIELKDKTGYALTPEGRKLSKALTPLNAWAERWAKRVK